jgi:DNA-binding response OmpR family regulator
MMNPLALIIEDNPELSTIFETALQQVGFKTDLDMAGNQFLEKLKAAKPDLIILDLLLPYASGVDIFHQIHDDTRWADIPIIVVTADLYLAKQLEGLTEHVLIKPVGVPRLQDIATRLWAKRAQALSDLSR